MINTRAIDYVTEDFYESLCFMDGERPDTDTIRSLFFGNGLLVNNTFGKAMTYTANEFADTIEEQVESGSLNQFMQRELFSKTEIFGRVAQRISVYEYSFSYHDDDNMHRGINYIQFIQDDDNWLITSMAWNDEKENNRIPEELLR